MATTTTTMLRETASSHHEALGQSEAVARKMRRRGRESRFPMALGAVHGVRFRSLIHN